MKVYSKRSSYPQDAVYVGRPTKWGNPFVVGVHGKQGECVELYRKWIEGFPAKKQQAREELAGRSLLCWCAPLPCHADVLLEIANKQE